MKKYEVFFTGKKTYLADNEEKALKAAEYDLKFTPPNLNLDLSGVKEQDI